MAVLTTVSEEDDIAEQQPAEYLWSDLKGRRNALSLWPEDLAAFFGQELTRYRSYESGGRDLSRAHRGLVEELIEMEAFVRAETASLIEQAPAEGVVVLRALPDQESFTACYPQAYNARRPEIAYPVMLHYVAVGRAAGELRRGGREVEIYRGEQHFELTAARAAVGLGKAETANLLGVNVKSYFRAERGVDPPRQGALSALREVDEFIASTADGLEVDVEDGVAVIDVVDDQAHFEATYPSGRFTRSDTPYPVRMLWVAAGRRAGALAAAGGYPVRIAASA